MESLPAAPQAPSAPPSTPPTPGAGMGPHLLPIWLPLIVAAIVAGALLAWLAPPPSRDDVAPVVRFSDATGESGLGGFRHRQGLTPAESPTTLGAGAVFFDYDGDGDEDLFLVNGADWPWEETFAKQLSRGGCALFRNDGAGRFTDVSASAGLNLQFPGMAAAAGDYDGDGRPDLFITGIGGNHLFRNRGDGRFDDLTEEAGVGGDDNLWSTGAAWVDVDGDGHLDLVVCHYARWPRDLGLDGAFAVALMGRSYGTPAGFVAAPPTVYRNRGDGSFEPVPGSAGLLATDSRTGLAVEWALAAVPVDANNDGRLDLLLAFHAHPAILFLNRGDGRFMRWSPPGSDRREGDAAGLASAAALPLLPAGGVDERLPLLRALGATPDAPGDEPPPWIALEPRLSVALGDFDHDGRLEGISAAGRLERAVNQFASGERDLASMPRVIWRGRDEAWRAVDLGAQSWARLLTGRAVAAADIDGDGDLDLLITQFGGPPVLLRNEQRGDVPWLAIDLVGREGRDPGGARVEVHTPRRIHVQTHAPAMGFFAQSASTLHFGLGDDARVRRIVVTWPDGSRQEIRPEGINRRIVIRQP